jgi:hypothetical protein
MRDLDVNTHARRLRAFRVIRAAATIALWACLGCGGGHERAATADAPTPTPTLPRASFSATLGPPRTPTGTPEPTHGGSPGPSHTPPPVGSTATISPTPSLTFTPSLTPTEIPPAQQHGRLQIGRVQAAPGTIVSIDVTLVDVDEGVEIAGTQNDISLDGSPIALVENTDGDPYCVVNPEIDKEGTGFAFQPPGCEASGHCTGMRALVVSLSNTDAIPSGSQLYSCNVSVSAAAEVGATYALPCSLALGSSPAGDLLGIGCDDGAIEVLPLPTPLPTTVPDEGEEGTCYESSTCDQFPMQTTRGDCCRFWLRSGLPCTWCPAGMIDPASGSCTACVHPCAGLPTPTSLPDDLAAMD